MGPHAMILVFWMLSLKPTFSLSSFTFIKRLFSSSLSAIRVVSSAYLRELPKFFTAAAADLLHVPREVKMVGQWTDWFWENLGETHIPNLFLLPITFLGPLRPGTWLRSSYSSQPFWMCAEPPKHRTFRDSSPSNLALDTWKEIPSLAFSELLLKSFTPGFYILWSELNDIWLRLEFVLLLVRKPSPLASSQPLVLGFFLFWLHPVACRILVPGPGMEPKPPAVGAQSLNPWTAREAPSCAYFNPTLHLVSEVLPRVRIRTHRANHTPELCFWNLSYVSSLNSHNNSY